MASVFLSYSREDQPVARAIALQLEKAGHSVWWDREIRGGAQFAKEIDRALAAADLVVVLWSVRSIDSAWVRDEAEAGRDSSRLVPTTIDGSRPPLGFRQYQTIDLAPWCKTRVPADFEPLLQALGAEKLDNNGAGTAAPQHAAPTTRRALIAGGAAAAAVAVSGGGWLLHRSRSNAKEPPQIHSLMVQAKQMMDQNSEVAQNQSIALYERAVKLAPDYPEAWGRLGLICGICSHYRQRREAIALRAKAESAAGKALQLDRDNVYGELAMAVARPFIGYWADWDRRMSKALAQEPRNDDLLAYRAVMLQFEGRAAAAVPLYQQISEKPFRPALYTNYIKALWTAGRPVELDDAMADAASLYPTQPSVWYTRFQILAFSGRADAAIALADDADGRPPDTDDEQISGLVRLARAIEDRNAAESAAIMAEQMQSARVEAAGAENSIRIAAALGRVDDAFAIADAYYFGRGFVIPDFAAKGNAFSPEQRQTRFLFEPVTAPMRADARFQSLVTQLGFARYWQTAGVLPDYRRRNALA